MMLMTCSSNGGLLQSQAGLFTTWASALVVTFALDSRLPCTKRMPQATQMSCHRGSSSRRRTADSLQPASLNAASTTPHSAWQASHGLEPVQPVQRHCLGTTGGLRSKFCTDASTSPSRQYAAGSTAGGQSAAQSLWLGGGGGGGAPLRLGGGGGGVGVALLRFDGGDAGASLRRGGAVGVGGGGGVNSRMRLPSQWRSSDQPSVHE